MNSWQQFLQWKHIRSHQRRDPNMWVTTPVLFFKQHQLTKFTSLHLNSITFGCSVQLLSSCFGEWWTHQKISAPQRLTCTKASWYSGFKCPHCCHRVLLISSPLSLCSTDSQCHLYAETNKDITVPLGITVANSMMLAWKKDETVIFRRRSGRVSKGAVGDVTQDGSLILKKVSKDKAGTYTPEVYTADGKAVGGMKSTKLCVIGRFLFICFSLSAVPGSETKVYISPLLWAWNITNYF